MMASLYSLYTDDSYNNFVAENIPTDLLKEDSYWLGYFSYEDELVATTKFKFWQNPDTKKNCWTMKGIFRKTDTDYEFSYSQDLFPDEIIDLINYGVDLAEKQGMRTGYSLIQDAVDENHRNYLKRIVDCVEPGTLRIGYDRYTHDVIEIIPPGKMSNSLIFLQNVNTVRFTVQTKIIEMNRI